MDPDHIWLSWKYIARKLTLIEKSGRLVCIVKHVKKSTKIIIQRFVKVNGVTEHALRKVGALKSDRS